MDDTRVQSGHKEAHERDIVSGFQNALVVLVGDRQEVRLLVRQRLEDILLDLWGAIFILIDVNVGNDGVNGRDIDIVKGVSEARRE